MYWSRLQSVREIDFSLLPSPTSLLLFPFPPPLPRFSLKLFPWCQIERPKSLSQKVSFATELVSLPSGTLEVSVVQMMQRCGSKQCIPLSTFCYLESMNAVNIQKVGVKDTDKMDRVHSRSSCLWPPQGLPFLKILEKNRSWSHNF